MINLLGEPLTGINFGEDQFSFPASQSAVYEKVIKESKSQEFVEAALREEYKAIICALKMMGIDFRIPLLYPGPADRSFLTLCEDEFGCQTMRLDGFPNRIMAYPRDICTVVEQAKLLLVSSRVAGGSQYRANGWNLIVSKYGEGGYVLGRGMTMIIGARLFEAPSEDIGLIEGAGVKIGMFPPIVNVEYSRVRSVSTEMICNGHVDRVACLLQGMDEKMHLIVDPLLVSASSNPEGWFLRKPSQTLDIIKDTFEPIGIKVHWPSKIEIPCSLNLVQFDSGLVLMTGGDRTVKRLVSSIVGEENVFDTAVPIKFLPAWKRAGIRCVIGKVPRSILMAV